MSKKQTTNLPPTIDTPQGEVILFTSDPMLLPEIDLPDGVTQETCIQIKWERPGQQLFGLYCGSVENPSSYENQDYFSFHEVQLENGITIGFIGSTQLDRALKKLMPYTRDVHIIFTEEVLLPPKKVFKKFLIFSRPTKAKTMQINPNETGSHNTPF